MLVERYFLIFFFRVSNGFFVCFTLKFCLQFNAWGSATYFLKQKPLITSFSSTFPNKHCTQAKNYNNQTELFCTFNQTLITSDFYNNNNKKCFYRNVVKSCWRVHWIPLKKVSEQRLVNCFPSSSNFWKCIIEKVLFATVTTTTTTSAIKLPDLYQLWL